VLVRFLLPSVCSLQLFSRRPCATPLKINEFAFQEIRGVINTQQSSLFNRQYSIAIDTLHDWFKGEIVDPWIKELREEGENALI